MEKENPLEENKDLNKEENNEVTENKKNIEEISKEVIETEEKEKKKSKKEKIIFHIIAIFCIAIFCMSISPKTLQNDTFYTVTIGDYIYNNGISDLTTDIYSWHELPYTYPHWLYDLGMFIIYNNFGQTGIYVSTMIFSAILGISVYVLCNMKAKNKIISAVITCLSIYLMRSFIAARAQLITFILFVWAVIAIEKFLETKKKRYAITLIAIPLLITNLHCAVFPFYFILFLPYIGEFLFVVLDDWNIWFRIKKLFFNIRKKLTKKEDKKILIDEKIEKIIKQKEERNIKLQKLRKNPYKVIVEKNYVVLLLITIMGIALLTGFINPAGDGAFTYLYKTLQGHTTESINEHLPLTLVENQEFAVALVVFLLVLIFTDTKIKLSDLFMLVGITFLSFNSRRQVSMFAIFCGPILAKLISDMITKYDKQTFEKLEKRLVNWFDATVIICFCIIGCTNLLKPTIHDPYVDEGSYPVEAANWMHENLDVKNIKLYNEYNYGSYLLFRGIPVFIDSRCDLYSPEFNGTYNKETKSYDGRDIFADALNIAGLGVDYKQHFKEYGVTHIILYEDSKLAMVLESDSDYKMLYDEGRFKIFERLNIVEN